VRVIPGGVASVASSEFDLNPRSSWPEAASNVAFAATDPAAEAGKEPAAVSRLGKTLCASGGCAGGTKGPDAVPRWGNSA
jgi:hypothetical protein